MNMGNIHLVTGYAGQEHVTAADQGAFHAALLGSGQFVLGKGNRLAASVVTVNQIRVLDGDIYMQGRHIRLNEGSYADIAIENGTQGYMRNDLIVARYTRDEVSGVEDVNLVVIKGENATSTPVDPAYTVGNILDDHAILNDMPLYRVPLNGLNVDTLVPLFTVRDATLRSVDEAKQDKTDGLTEETTIADGDSFPFYDASVSGHRKTTWTNIKSALAKVFASKTHSHSLSSLGAAAAGHKHSADDVTSGILPASRGGTGVETIAALAVAMGMPKIATGTYVGTGAYGVGNPITLTFGFTPKLVVVQANGALFGAEATSGGRWALMLNGVQRFGNTASKDSYGQTVHVVWGDGTVQWYCNQDYPYDFDENDGVETTGHAQLNALDVTYHYFAIG